MKALLIVPVAVRAAARGEHAESGCEDERRDEE